MKKNTVREALPEITAAAAVIQAVTVWQQPIAKGEAPVNACPVGGAAAAAKIGEIMGQEAGGKVFG